MGRSVPSEYLVRISEFLGVSVEYLLTSFDDDNCYNNNDLSNSKDVAFGENAQINKNNEMDNLSHEMINEFEKLSFVDKAKVISLIAKLREKIQSNKIRLRNFTVKIGSLVLCFLHFDSLVRC